MKKTIYCLDCSNDFCKALEDSAFKVIDGSLGLSKKFPKFLHLDVAPNECDTFVFNLTDPACFDALHWGPGKNDNFRCAIVDKTTREKYVQGGTHGDGREYPRYKLVQSSHISKNSSAYDEKAIQDAVAKGAINFIYFLNESFLFHASLRTPSPFGLYFDTKQVKAQKYSVSDKALGISGIFKQLDEDVLKIKRPISFQLCEFWVNGKQGNKEKVLPLIVNNVNDCFGAAVQYGEGWIWFFPEFQDPVKSTIKLITDIIPSFNKDHLSLKDKKRQAFQDNITQLQAGLAKISSHSTTATKKSIFVEPSILSGTRTYIERIVWQINECYGNEAYDAAAAMMRRLVETLIIEIYETNGRLGEIKKGDEIQFLDGLIDILFKDKSVHISRGIKKVLATVKKLGDTGAHNRKVNLQQHNLDDIKVDFKIGIEELKQNSKWR